MGSIRCSNMLEALGDVGDAAGEGVMMHDRMFLSDRHFIVAIRCSLSGARCDEAAVRPWLQVTTNNKPPSLLARRPDEP